MDFVPTATYRLQFNPEFTFADATRILDYLHALGISDVYSSPFFQAGAGSTHGYDVADHNRINAALGGEKQFREFVAGLQARGMGHVLDFVPNHMGISEPINRWWMDVLENGTMSPYQAYFDIEWHPIKQELENKVLLPILGDRYGQALEGGHFHLALEGGAFFVRYHEAKLPLNPRSYSHILSRAATRLPGERERISREELLSISNALSSLPEGSAGGEDQAGPRVREIQVSKRRLARLAQEAPEVAAAIAETLRDFDGRAGEPASFDAMHELLSAQAYRLAYWRVAAEEINYRRFFDINTLAAIRSEISEVFEASHELIFKMIERGDITGVRIDHIDGLWDPQGYLDRLRERIPGKPVYLVVEKILGTEEGLPISWPVDGTTGYEFASDLTALLIDPAGERPFTELYAEIAGETRLADLIYEKKLLITRMSMASEIAALGGMLNRLSETNRHYRDFTLNQLTAAVRETMACFPVYRTYVTPEARAKDEDRLVILRAVRKARQRNPAIDRPIFDFLAKVLQLETGEDSSPQDWEEKVRFAMKFQQCSGPVMAKGLEDTAFYIYHRFAALNEVGGDPGRFGLPPAEFHQRCARRHEQFPNSLLATSTHDTKRSEDVRARLAALSELPGDWRRLVLKSVALNAGHKTELDGRLAPSPNEEYLLYQTLAGVWPLEPLTGARLAEFIARVQDYMVKALKEAKVNSSWIEPNEDWEQAARQFVARVLDPESGKKFRRLFEPFVERLAPLGAANSLAQVVLKGTTPGVPDFYQGCEIWDFSMVDPDNRRPVDYAARAALLEGLEKTTAGPLLAGWRDGRLKLFVTRQLLRFRHEHSAVFRFGAHRPLAATGAHAERLVAFLREHEGAQVAVVVPRLTAPLGFPALGKVWRNTTIDLPPGRWREAFFGREFSMTAAVPVAELLKEFPVACLVRVG